MKMNLVIIAKDLEGIRKALKELSEDDFHSNCCGEIDGETPYDYCFTNEEKDINDLFNDNPDAKVINPNK